MGSMKVQKAFKVLGLKPGATKNDIRKAFKRKARETHPDMNGKPGAEDKFKVIGEAYEILNGGKTKDTFRINSQPYNATMVDAANATKEEVDELFMGREWNILRGCITINPDFEVQKHAIDYFASEKRFYDLFGVVGEVLRCYNLERIDNYILSVFERNIDVLINEAFLDSSKDCHHIKYFVLENTENFEVAKQVLENISFEAIFLYQIKNKKIFKYAMNLLEETECWRGIVENAGWSFTFLNTERGKYCISILERNLEKIIATDQKEVLVYPACSTQSYEIGVKIIDVLIEAEDYWNVKEIARLSEPNAIKGILESCAWGIAKYAVDALAKYERKKELSEVANFAKMEDIREYAKAKNV